MVEQGCSSNHAPRSGVQRGCSLAARGHHRTHHTMMDVIVDIEGLRRASVFVGTTWGGSPR